MATKNTTLRNLIADAQGDAFDNDGGGAADLEIRASNETVLVAFTLNDDAFAAASSGQINANGLSKTATASAGGTADHARITSLTSGGATDCQITGISVSTSGTPVTIDNTDITSGQDVTLTSLSITEDAGYS